MSEEEKEENKFKRKLRQSERQEGKRHRVRCTEANIMASGFTKESESILSHQKIF